MHGGHVPQVQLTPAALGCQRESRLYTYKFVRLLVAAGVHFQKEPVPAISPLIPPPSKLRTLLNTGDAFGTGRRVRADAAATKTGRPFALLPLGMAASLLPVKLTGRLVVTLRRAMQHPAGHSSVVT